MMPGHIARMGQQQRVGRSFLSAFGGGGGAMAQRNFWRGAGALAVHGRVVSSANALNFSGIDRTAKSHSTECNAASNPAINSTTATTQKAGEVEFYSGGANYASLNKNNGGEDSYFVTYLSGEDRTLRTSMADSAAEADESLKASGFCMMGVADGVGGWADIGVDAGLYSRQLMHLSSVNSETQNPANPNPKQVLYEAVQDTTAKGSATVCIVALTTKGEGASLRAANLGDSGFIVVREKQVMFKSPVQQHSFNFPYQVSSLPKYSDNPMTAETFSYDVMPGDTIVLGTDGLFDNLYPEEVASIVYQAKANGTKPGELAHILAKITLEVATDKKRDTPFANGARAVGFPHEFGGKMDDVTCVVSYVQRASKL